MPRLSAIVITRNEAGNIAECLDTIAFCDERIVIDCGSTDDTVAIARAKGATVAYHAWEGFGAQKNHALSLASGDCRLADNPRRPLASTTRPRWVEPGASLIPEPRSSAPLKRLTVHRPFLSHIKVLAASDGPPSLVPRSFLPHD